MKTKLPDFCFIVAFVIGVVLQLGILKFGVIGALSILLALVCFSYGIYDTWKEYRKQTVARNFRYIKQERERREEEAYRLAERLKHHVEYEEHKLKTFKTDEQKKVDELLNVKTNDVIENFIANPDFGSKKTRIKY